MRIPEGTAKILAKVPLPDEVAVVHRNAAVVDIGACKTRIGFAGDDIPRVNEPTCVLRGGEQESTLYLRKAYDKRAIGDTVRVIEDKEVNWDAMELLLQHLDDILHLSNSEVPTPLLLTEKMLVPRAHRQRLAEMLFEKHNLCSVYFAPSPALALYASGVCSGVSVEMGYDACHVVPVFQGCPMFHAVHALEYGGKLCTQYMMNTGQPLPDVVHPRHRVDVWEHIKEKNCETCPSSTAFRRAVEMEANMNSSNEENEDYSGRNKNVVHHKLPDGTIISLGSSRFVPSEMLFDPSLAPTTEHESNHKWVEHFEYLHTYAFPQGIHRLLVDSVRKCDTDLQGLLYGALHLSGGCSLLSGLPERLRDDVASITAQAVHVEAQTERRDAAFVGGSILASLPTFQNFWVTRAEYTEFGAGAVLRRGL
ncbi:actin, putative [Trypanosoma brucei gambiense DAL972]|uniref:Actin, putative n=1 Tax=Trypanosoma brucei gambiense (strain MHOM/CI/86/DAL972) TaxID=679716 RepID=C9ZXR9_TRYB9|nr:actin, putative [Trypanosoma brucei gambiense DAL972]CBH14214.1 actin, putative [Trypanosoma brucei gambiense DAL972]|eukprot:XP_011776484.1 actin, putative [Trypanosoma brucei gambiense DAL972]